MSYDCVCDYDPPEFYDSKIKIARKGHRCAECAGHILPGDKYEYVAGRWDGFFGTFNTCERCVDIRVWTKNNVPCLCWAHHSLIEDCLIAVDEAAYRAPEETRGLRFGLLRRIAARDKFNAARRA